jgi:hypothetical protein
MRLLWTQRGLVARILVARETIQKTPGTFEGVPEHRASQQYMQ